MLLGVGFSQFSIIIFKFEHQVKVLVMSLKRGFKIFLMKLRKLYVLLLFNEFISKLNLNAAKY